MTVEELQKRVVFCNNPNIYCHTGGFYGGEPNYGYPHVSGTVYWKDGTISNSNYCIFCGSKY